MIARYLAQLILVSVCNAALFQSIGDLPKKVDYDFVIAGGGTAGAVLANRLTENPKFKVLVIEGGPSNEGALLSEIPWFAFYNFGTTYDWNYTTTPQTGLNGREIPYPRGHILGGSSAINGAVYTRGSTSDYDRYAALSGDKGWSWDNMLPYLLKAEKWSAPADNHNTTGQYDPRFHSTTGINADSLNGYPYSTNDKVIQTTKDLSDKFPFNLDANSGNPLGLSWAQATIGNGTRSTSATSYLGPKFINRSNLHVVVNTKVTRVLRSSSKAKPDIRTVEVYAGANKTITFTAKKELILSTGAVGTPTILQHSGIGDKTALTKLGITSVAHLPDVGQNLSDHIGLQIPFAVNTNDTSDNLTIDPANMEKALAEWNATRTGPLVNIAGGVGHLSFMRLPANSSIFNSVPDPSSGLNSAHYELVFSNGGGGSPSDPRHFITVGVALVTPTSKGSIVINSTNPLDSPVINPNAVGTDFDIFTLRYGLRNSLEFIKGPAWQGFILGAAGGFENVNVDDDAQVDTFIRNSGSTVFHPIGTAAMSPKNANYGVVDPDLKVKGVSGLRVVDGSVLPVLICGHTQAPVYGFAERASDLIKGSWA